MSPQWKQLYQAAILDVDRSLLPRRIVVAESAISHRITELDSNPNSGFDERDALAKACLVLRRLRRLADEGKLA